MEYRYPPFRFALLVLTFSGAVLALGKVTVFPVKATSYTAPYTFPEQVSINAWKSLSSQSLSSQNTNGFMPLSGRRYQYLRENTRLEIEMYYFANTDGNVGAFLKNKTPGVQFQNRHFEKSGTGYYNLFSDPGKAYLSACINPHGGSTVTSTQFKENRNTYDVSSRFIPWLLGKGQLQDNRCLWAHLSVPLSQSSIDTAYQTLKDAWIPWHEWWSQNFPES